MSDPFPDLAPCTRPAWIVAHRGASADYPENTMASLRAAAQTSGVHAVECDVQLSRDGVPVVIHDPDLRRIAKNDARVADLNLTELSRIDAGRWFRPEFAGEPIPSLDHVLAQLPNTRFWLELKVDLFGPAQPLAAAVADCIKRHHAESRVHVLSFDPTALADMRSVASSVPLVRLLREPPDGPDAWERAVDGCSAVDISHRLLQRAFVREAHHRNRAVAVYTCNTEEEANRANALGVDAVTTDRPAWLAGLLGGR